MPFLPTSSVNAMGFVALVTTPGFFSLSLDLPHSPLYRPSHPPGSPSSVDCYFYVILPPCHLFLCPSPPSDPSITHHIQPAHHCQLMVIFKGGPSSSHRCVSPLVSLMGWALLRSSPLPSSPSPLTSLACLSIAGHILPGHHHWLIKSCNCLH